MKPDIQHAERAFKQWRANRPGRTHTPSDLREMAVALVPHYPTRIICETLGVNSRSLKSWSASVSEETFVTLPTDVPKAHTVSDSEVTLTITLSSGGECQLSGSFEPEWIATVIRSIQVEMRP